MSINNITYLKEIYPHGFIFFNTPKISKFLFTDYLEINSFLKNLEDGKSYVVSLEFVITWCYYKDNSPVITLSDPILITKNSNAKLISKFIRTRISIACDNYLIDEDITNMLIQAEGPGVICKYNEINLF